MNCVVNKFPKKFMIISFSEMGAFPFLTIDVFEIESTLASGKKNGSSRNRHLSHGGASDS